ncbi:hypothetical protein [Fibrella forsythiae]|uniref:Transposase n=1 Tax=Fibrella forsythiae TaxID=2817061 RepID=A0ABS3JLU6_9BACT|nr:hypothetical protein [Fibrella forsythiae]MBO0950981.1 hypothetical protein [Fibrella forsythiae]
MPYSVGKTRFTGDFHMIALKKIKSGYVLYGKTKYDHDSGLMVFVKLRQIIAMSNVQVAVKGFLIFFHEEYPSPLEEKIMWDSYDKV